MEYEIALCFSLLVSETVRGVESGTETGTDAEFETEGVYLVGKTLM